MRLTTSSHLMPDLGGTVITSSNVLRCLELSSLTCIILHPVDVLSCNHSSYRNGVTSTSDVTLVDHLLMGTECRQRGNAR